MYLKTKQNVRRILLGHNHKSFVRTFEVYDLNKNGFSIDLLVIVSIKKTFFALQYQIVANLRHYFRRYAVANFRHSLALHMILISYALIFHSLQLLFSFMILASVHILNDKLFATLNIL